MRGPFDPVLDEVTVTRGINDCVMPLLHRELVRDAGNGQTTLTLLLLAVHVEDGGPSTNPCSSIFREIVSQPSRGWQNWRVLLDEIILHSNLH